jgi:hypothetical protein
MKFGLLACVLSIGQALQQGDSIVDAARRQGGAATVVIHINAGVGTVEELANASSLILRGKVVSLATRLSKDERIVVTEYEIAPQTFYKGSFAVQSRPGLATGLIVQRPGGTMSLNGLKLNTTLEDFPEYEAPKVGEEMILFLTRSEMEPGKFLLIGNASGAFRIAEGKVAALTAGAARRRGASPQTFQEFERDLRRLLAR